MTGGRLSLASLSALLIVLACGDGRESGTPTTDRQSSDRAAAAGSDTAAVAPPDTAVPAPAPRESAASARDTSPSVAQAPAKKPAAAPKPAPQPAAPKPTPAPAESAAAPAPVAAQPAQPAAPPAEGGAPLRDTYHQAPRDTVTAEVYEGWKQFNLNCARCHGEDVLGTTIAPQLLVSVRPGGAVDTKEAYVQTVCAGRPEKGMPAWCALGMEMEKINATYAYVKGRSEGKIGPGRPARRD
ncbi:MAG TPA: c-type cytochrome [Gemmatimonadales bacterium]|nr:c-type cytochrome [Gemmatimonadales bacterium]